MIRICSVLYISAALVATSAQAADKKKVEAQPKTIVNVVGDILMAPVKLIEDLTRPVRATPAKK